MSGLAEVVTLYDSNMRDVPTMLRRLADDIEAGLHGDVQEAAAVVFGDTLDVMGWGRTQDGGSTALLLQAGAQRLITEVANYGR
jgi:hypothetical protein